MRAAHGLSIASFVGLLAVAAVSACVREGAAVVAPVEVTIDNGDGGPAMPLVIAAPSVPIDRDRCTAVLRAATIKTNPGCTLDERLSHGNGTLLYPCAGDGPVEAIFGEHHFNGKITESAVTLALGTELDWEDGCHWETKQVILGTWKRDANANANANAKKRPKLSWSYSEAPVNGTGCYGSCTATAEIEIVSEDVKP
jgi:hypothetical protein